MAATSRSDSQLNWKETAGFLNSATRGAQSLIEDSGSFSDEIERVNRQAIRDIESLPPCPDKDLHSKKIDFRSSLEAAVSRANNFSEQCKMLGKEVGKFDEFITPLLDKDTLSDSDVALCVQKLEALLPMLQNCEKGHRAANKKLGNAIKDCLDLANEFDTLKQKADEENSSAKMRGVLTTAALGAATVGATMVAGPFAAPVVAKLSPTAVAVGLGAGTIASGVHFWSESSRLEKLASDFNLAGGRLRTTKSGIEHLMKRITELKLQVESMAQNIAKAHKAQKAFKNTMDAKNKEIEDLQRKNEMVMALLMRDKK